MSSFCNTFAIIYYDFSPLSESAGTVGAGLAIPAMQSGFMPMVEVFKLAITNFKVNDWGLFKFLVLPSEMY